MAVMEDLRKELRSKKDLSLPVIRALRILGDDISKARRRRRISMQLMAERMAVSRSTLSKIEKGDPAVAMSAYAMALFVLGMLEKLKEAAAPAQDGLGIRLDEERLPKRIRASRKNGHA
jgi:transcriptional regulator with XRE-family HTH domain